jgi:hypothetical protein
MAAFNDCHRALVIQAMFSGVPQRVPVRALSGSHRFAKKH